jgi:sugar lactone lactonase YvrE
MKHQYLPALLGLALLGHSLGKTVPNHALADLVLGQPNFTSGSALIASASSLRNPVAIAIDPVTRKIFVADNTNRRVLRYQNIASLNNGAPAEVVFGQFNMSSNSSGSGVSGMSNPTGLFFDRNGRLWVADFSSNRVLMFQAASFRTDGASADRVYGQPDFNTTTAGTTAAKMNDPFSVCVDSEDRLWVADFGNNRVLRINDITNKPSGASADGVLGQFNLNSGGAGVGASGMSGPTGVSIAPGGALFVNCYNQHRVLRFDNAANRPNGAAANAVFGQPDFASMVTATAANGLSFPTGVWATPDDSLWICDLGNNRILRFDKASNKPSASSANGVIGQPDFVSSAFGTTRRDLDSPSYQAMVDSGGNLWVPDNANHRVLRFPADITKPLLTLKTKVPPTVTTKKLKIKGTASDLYGISKVKYRIGNGPWKNATGTTQWQFTAAIPTGNTKITIAAVDSVGNNSKNKVVKVTR